MGSLADFFGALPPVAEETPPAATAPVAGGVGGLESETDGIVVLPWPIPRDHLSASSFGMWARCPEQWRRRYILGQKEAPGAAQILGSGFHIAQEHNFRQKIESHEDLAVAEIVEAFHHGWDTKIEDAGGVNEISWGSDKPDTLRARGATLTSADREQVSPKLQPEAVELAISLELEGIPVPIQGHIDLVGQYENGVPWDPDYAVEPTTVDYKTSSKSVSKLKEDWGIQARIYQAHTKRPIEYHVAVKTATPKIQTPIDVPGLKLEYDVNQIALMHRTLQRYVKQMLMYWERFGPDEVWPSGAPFYGWACGYCGFAASCALRNA